MDKQHWQSEGGEVWAAEWRRTDKSFGVLTEELLRRTREFSYDQALDLGCGAGELALALARGRPQSQVIGVDVSDDLVATASRRGANLGNVQFLTADAAQWKAPEGFAPQLVTSRHGVMFFDDPIAAFSNFHKLAEKSANLLFSCFRSPSENPIFTEIARLLPEPAEPPAPPIPGAPSPFAFADPDHVKNILSAAGWQDISLTPFNFGMIVGTGADPIEETVEYFARIGPAAAVAGELDAEARERFFYRIRALAQANCHENIVALPAGCWIVSASAS